MMKADFPYEIIVLEDQATSKISRLLAGFDEQYTFSIFHDEEKVFFYLGTNPSPVLIIADVAVTKGWDQKLPKPIEEIENIAPIILVDSMWSSSLAIDAAHNGFFNYLSFTEPYFSEKLRVNIIRAGHHIRQSETDSSSLFSGRVIVDQISGLIVEASPRALEMMGLGASDVVNKPLRKFLHKTETVATLDTFNVADYKPLRFELYRPDNRVIPILALPRYINYGEKKMVQVMLRDVSEQRFFEQLVRESETHIKFIIDYLPDGIITLSDNNIIRMVNRSTEQMLHYQQNELAGISAEAIFKNGIPKANVDEPDYNAEVELIRKDGTILTIAISSGDYMVRDKKFRVFTLRDMSETLQRNSELLTANLRLNSLITNMPAGVMVVDENCKVVLANNQFCQLFKLPQTPAMLVGSDCLENAHACQSKFANAEGFVKRIEEITHTRKAVLHEEVKLSDNGILERDFIPLEIAGEDRGAMWIYRDITERKRNEQLLLQKTALLEAISEASNNLLVNEEYEQAIHKSLELIGLVNNVDVSYLFEIHNDSFSDESIGIPHHHWRNDRLDKNTKVGTDNIYFQKLSPNFYKQLSEKQVVAALTRNLPEPERSRLQAQHIMSVLIVPVFMANGFWGFLGLDDYVAEREWSNDQIAALSALAASIGGVMSRINYAESLRTANEYLKSINGDLQKSIEYSEKMAQKAEMAGKAKTDFLSSMSHEIRTPLNSIVGLTNLLLRDQLSDIQRENLETIKTSSDTLLRTVNDILDFSKIEAGKISFEKIEFEPRRIMKQMMKTFEQKAHEQGLDLSYEVDDKLPNVLRGDPFRLSQILINLINNALKFTHKGSVIIKIRTEHILEAEHQCSLVFSVSDTGIGISKDNISALFDSFTQVNSSVARNYGGTGLGLAICRNLIELQGGVIGVESELGKGSTFWFALNFEVSALDKLTEVESDASMYRSLSGLRIIMAEDNVANQFLSKQIFERWSATLDIANNGLDVLAMMAANSYDLLLLDLQMPVKDGFETLKEMRAYPDKLKNPTIPIITLSADAFPETKSKVFSLGAKEFVLKPFDEKELYEKIVNLTSELLINNKSEVKLNSVAASEQKVENKTVTAKKIDLSYLETVTNGNKEAFKRLLKIYTDQVSELCMEQKKCLATSNFEEAGRIAHKLKPLFESLGDMSLRMQYQEIEKRAKDQDFNSDLKELIEKAISDSLESENELKRILESTSD